MKTAALIFAIGAVSALALIRAFSGGQWASASPETAPPRASVQSQPAALAMSVGEVSDANFETEVLKAAGPVVVNFWADWCGPCRRTTPMLDKIAGAMGDKVRIVKVDVDKNMQTASKYGVMSVPTSMIFKGGAMISSQVGEAPKEKLQQWINNNLLSLGRQGNANLDRRDGSRLQFCERIASSCHEMRDCIERQCRL
jgi:thioredoxin 1